MPLKQSVKKFLHKNFKVSGIFSSHEFDQTDFGRIYFNMPQLVERPRTVEDLARLLKHYHQLGKPVTIRNTGHSVNGQTLTDGIQIYVGDINHVQFDARTMEVAAGCGASWDSILKKIHFPRYCLPVFPNNPGQKIHIGGSASVGGIGFYGSSGGGLWNHVSSITLVTMTGDVIQCSERERSDFFHYALGGYGRIGVIAELTIRVVESASRVAVAGLLYRNQQHQLNDLDRILGSSVAEGVMLSNDSITLPGHVEGLVHSIGLLKEVHSAKQIREFDQKVRSLLHPDMIMYYEDIAGENNAIIPSFSTHALPKKDVVYWYPASHGEDQLGLCHPWTDGVVGRDSYPDFMNEARRLVHAYGMEKNLTRQSVFGSHIAMSMVGVYIIRKLHENFPLSMDLPGDSDYALGPALLVNVPKNQLPKALSFASDLSNLFYEHGGKIYLYGLHSLSKKQVEQHFTRAVIHEWQKIKDTLDPKHLLNRGVIEHLDDM